MPLESLQYVLGVGTYRTVLKMHEPAVRAYAMGLALERVGAGDDWWALSRRLHVPVVQLKLHNPFLAARSLTAGNVIVYPKAPREAFFTGEGGTARYQARIGDNYLKLAFTLDVDADRLRDANGLWRLESLVPGTMLSIPLDPPRQFTEYRVADGDGLDRIASRLSVDAWWIVRDNQLWDEQVRTGTVLRIRQPPPKPAYQTHVVRSGDNLTAIGRRYGVTVAAIQSANQLGRRSLIRVGDRLRIPIN
jgi:LysM repeat protein